MINEKEIGGYLGLELSPRCKNMKFMHSDGILVNFGNSAFEITLRSMPNLQTVWLSYYTCESVLEPILRLGLSYRFYRLKETLEIDDSSLLLSENDCLVYNNYFGIKDLYICELFKKYGAQLIIDNAQSYGSHHLPNSNAIYSPRKSFGVPDGGVAYVSDELDSIDLNMYENDFSFDRCSHLLKRIDVSAGEGYGDFKSTGKLLHTLPIRRMSNLTKTLLASIDYEKSTHIRQQNYYYIHDKLKHSNLLANICEDIDLDFFPAFYPFYSEDKNIRQYLIDHKIFVALYWPNVMNWLHEDQSSTEFKMAQNILPIPIDQRYDKDDMDQIITLLEKYEK